MAGVDPSEIKIFLKYSCQNIFVLIYPSDSVHMHLQYRTRPGGGEFHAKLRITLNKARTQQYLKGNRLIWSTDEAVTEGRESFSFQ